MICLFQRKLTIVECCKPLLEPRSQAISHQCSSCASSAQVSGQKQLEVSGHLPPTDPACFPVWAGDGFARDALRADHPNLQKWCTTICVLSRIVRRSMVVLLNIGGKCSCLRAKAAHISSHLPPYDVSTNAPRSNTFQIRRCASQTKPLQECHPERSEGSLSGKRS